jgi:hypothetical protein
MARKTGAAVALTNNEFDTAFSRSSPRYRLLLDAELQHAGTLSVARVHDLSNSGGRLETELYLPVGSDVLLVLPVIGAVQASVVRLDNDSYGLNFRTWIPDSIVQRARQESQVVWLKPDAGNITNRHERTVELNLSPAVEEPAEVLPRGKQVMIILGLCSLLWAAIIGSVWAVTPFEHF